MKPGPISQSVSQQGSKRSFPWVKKGQESSSSCKPFFSKTIMPKASAFKTAFSENKKIVIKKTLPAKSDYFSFKNPTDQGQASKRNKM